MVLQIGGYRLSLIVTLVGFLVLLEDVKFLSGRCLGGDSGNAARVGHSGEWGFGDPGILIGQ